MSAYDPNSMIEELRIYQERAEAYFDDNMTFTEDVRIYGENVTVDHSHRGPDLIKLELLDDIIPLSIEVYEIEYRLHSIEGDKATFKY